MTAPDQRLLESMLLFQGVAPGDLSRIRKRFSETAYPAGADIVTAEQPGDEAYVILQGAVKIHTHVADQEVILSLLGRGDLVGELSLIDSLGRSATVTTLEDSRLLSIGRDSFHRLLDEVPAMAGNLILLLSRRLRLADARVQTLAALDVPGRVARALLSLGIEYGEAAGDALLIPIPITQRDLAALVGASRVRVNQVLGNFRRRGLLSIQDQRFTIHDPAMLAARCR